MGVSRLVALQHTAVNWARILGDWPSTSDTPLFQLLIDRLRDAVVRGALAAGMRLPSTRAMSRILGVSPVTVAKVYGQLIRDGVLQAQHGRGTYVAAAAAAAPAAPPIAEHQVAEHQVAEPPAPEFGWPASAPAGERARLLAGWMAAVDPRDGIQLIGGYGDWRLPPARGMAASLRRTAAADEGLLLSTCPATGHPEARSLLAGACETLYGIAVRPDDLIVGAGSHALLDNVIRTFLAPGDVVACETPTFYGALDLFAIAGVRVVHVPCDAQGIRPDQLEAVLATRRPKLVYLTGLPHNPTGAVMSPARRDALAGVLKAHLPLVVEDASGAPFHYGNAPPPTLKSTDDNGQVIFLASLSKLLFPALRLGIAVASSEVLSRLAATIRFSVRISSYLMQTAVARYVTSARFQRDLRGVRQSYRARRDALLETLERHAPPGASWRAPEAGLSLWLELPPGVSGEHVSRILAPRQIHPLPGGIFLPNPESSPALRLSFGQHPPDILAQAGQAICEAIRAAGETRFRTMNDGLHDPIA